MKLLSIDLETSGLDPNSCCVLEIGCVLFDPDPEIAVNETGRRWETFNRLISHKRIVGEPYALAMNADVIAEISGRKETHISIVPITTALADLAACLRAHGVTEENKVTVVGKNFDRFDLQFLNRCPGWRQHVEPLLERRSLDAGSLLFSPHDGAVLPLDKCLERIGVRDNVAHRALDDALQVATVVSRFFS